ncbi:FtsK/SpoIIIE domain-containing protein [Paenarthrobacter ilicis]|uniref:S-DNA-T family DNA segregation ATPase FtsK/SpoIIIE n=1 Tax=Paenarthrobacter ilicis TaxID=43665 RepID=A0ABX0TFF9_9MICC|nr:FtsK/SpoIIIE domain-containing protein [Paenarthrobacter ilicis]MBM7793755.1 S-DNA-T family DNA segregation ATPase FtsK/SpoIIIE [Paenarthrobacter ilicis]NII99934.1 S-DNA-T family DNA segregation ATPase FtsK/SpoIIIE [Paenarthrobacter ilicis]
MALECTLVRTPASGVAALPQELTIAVPAGTPGETVQALIREAYGTGLLNVAGQPLANLSVGTPPLVHGAVVVDGAVVDSYPGQSFPKPDAAPLPLMLLTHSGPAAGSIFSLERGRFTIGRGQADITVPDAGMSRQHAVLDISGTAMMLSTLKGAASTFLEGRPVRRQSPVSSASKIRCANSDFGIEPGATASDALRHQAGFSVERPLEVQHDSPERNRAALVALAGAPIIAGIALLIFTGSWMFLGFTAISALTMLLPVLSGRKGRRDRAQAVARAVCADVKRRERCSPSAAELVMSCLGSKDLPGLTAADTEGGLDGRPEKGIPNEPEPGAGRTGWIRLGTAEAVANIRLLPHDPGFRPPSIGRAALTLDPRQNAVNLQGPQHHVDALLRFMLMQFASQPGSEKEQVIVVGPVHRLPLCARFLPGTHLATNHASALSLLRGRTGKTRGGKTKGQLILIDDHPQIHTGSMPPLVETFHQAGWRVIDASAARTFGGTSITLETSGTSATLDNGEGPRTFTPDLVPATVFDAFCRRAAARAPAGADVLPGIPDRCTLEDLLGMGPRHVLRRWEHSPRKEGLVAAVGRGSDRTMTFDFHRDGPHLLVAGTTGAGKSGLLRTLVASMALTYPPDHTTFLLVDFKGGSGLGALSGLPHCVGFLTDLGEHQLDRTLTSLRAEVKHREKELALANVVDLAQYQRSTLQTSSPLPYLILVIDEFRMLVDDAPGALRELMRLATIGRSLGIHLVMATQRPQGALTSDIRANVTSSIALRVQSEADSHDVIGHKAAALISVDLPGRAFFAKASSAPEEFQTATMDGSAAADHFPAMPPPVVQCTQEALERCGFFAESGTTVGRSPGGPAATENEMERVVRITRGLWAGSGKQPPRPPVAPSLPAALSWAEEVAGTDGDDPSEAAAAVSAEALMLGLVDVPAQQSVNPLLWSPWVDGHLALIGNDASGMSQCFRAVAAMVVSHRSRPHVYALDGAGLLDDIASDEVLGARATLADLPVAGRVLHLIKAEMERRRSSPSVTGANPPLALLISGWCSWVTTARNGQYSWMEETLHDIVRDGPSRGISVLISGGRELLGSRMFGEIASRAYFPCGSTDESRFHWPRLPDMASVVGRAAITGAISGGRTEVAQFRMPPATVPWPFRELEAAKYGFLVQPLPWPVSSGSLSVTSGGSRGPLWVGVGGDTASPVALPLPDRAVCAVLGSPLSGKSTLLESLRTLNPAVPWLFPQGDGLRTSYVCSLARRATAGVLDPDSILQMDDAEFLDAQGRQALEALFGKIRGVVLAATTGASLVHQMPLAHQIRTSGCGVILQPRTPHDAELLGTRVIADQLGPAGRGYIIQKRRVTPFQTAVTTT